MIQEVHDMAGQHETISENLTTSITREVHAMLQELKQERKKASLLLINSCMFFFDKLGNFYRE